MSGKGRQYDTAGYDRVTSKLISMYTNHQEAAFHEEGDLVVGVIAPTAISWNFLARLSLPFWVL